MAKSVKPTKTVKLKAWEKVYQYLMSGNVVSKEEFEQNLGSEILMYRMSTFIWAVKKKGGGVVKVVKDGRKVTGYQLVNVATAKAYLEARGVKFEAPVVQKLEDLNAKPAEAVSTESVEQV